MATTFAQCCRRGALRRYWVSSAPNVLVRGFIDRLGSGWVDSVLPQWRRAQASGHNTNNQLCDFRQTGGCWFIAD
ncbi:hypothetical protein KCP78_16420 [Salmonella enterica subsp. enterica]|nr:hypothetical protein KCP78_16420 [Salmonella enterica subsp. enterica]